jgi:hypothetical protein
MAPAFLKTKKKEILTKLLFENKNEVNTPRQ